MAIAIFVSIGLLAGVLSGLFGIGGGSLMVPALIALAGMDVLHASATSLAAMLLPVGALGVWEYHKAGLVQWKVAAWLSLGLLGGSAIGAESALSLPTFWLERGYAVFLLYVSVSYLGLWDLLRGKSQDFDPGPRKDAPVFIWLATGFAAGIVAGLFGKGGGIIIIPILTFFFAFRTKEANGTSLAALQLPVGLPGVLLYARNGVLDIRIASMVAAGLVAGTFFGTRIAIGLKPILVKRLFGLFLLVVSAYLFFR